MLPRIINGCQATADACTITCWTC